jgi:hypothetical protein
MNDVISQMIDNIESDKHAEAQEDFGSIISVKLTDALEQRKQEIAQQLGARDVEDIQANS